MSSILNALRKLEEERRPASEGPLQEDVALAPVRSSSLALWAAAVSAGIAVAVVSVLVMRSFWSEGPAAPEPPETGSAASSASVRPVPAAAELATARRALVDRRQPGPTGAVDRVARSVRQPPVARRRKAAAPPPTPAASLREPPPEVAVGQSAPREATPAARAQPEPPARPAPAPAPVEVETPEPAPMRVAQIAWHPDADLRRAWLRVEGDRERREVREGDQVGSYTVLLIEPSSVLFQSGDIELHQKLGDQR